ncbi:MAG: hypothetical protein JW969_07520 [Spirochaetales bacterium]|nr:hypothetical protein [Spirochaetales bacterium]
MLKLVDFFTPDDGTYETMIVPFDEGLHFIRQIRGLREEIYLATPILSGNTMLFIDIGFNAQVTLENTTVKINADQLMSYLYRNRLRGRFYLIHNHPKEGISPPSFPDYFVLSNLLKDIESCELDVELVGIVVAKKDIWIYNTTWKSEEKIFELLRTPESTFRPGDSYLSTLLLHYNQDWDTTAKKYEDDPYKLIDEMEKKGVQLLHYSSIYDFTRSLFYP